MGLTQLFQYYARCLFLLLTQYYVYAVKSSSPSIWRYLLLYIFQCSCMYVWYTFIFFNSMYFSWTFGNSSYVWIPKIFALKWTYLLITWTFGNISCMHVHRNSPFIVCFHMHMCWYSLQVWLVMLSTILDIFVNHLYIILQKIESLDILPILQLELFYCYWVVMIPYTVSLLTLSRYIHCEYLLSSQLFLPMLIVSFPSLIPSQSYTFAFACCTLWVASMLEFWGNGPQEQVGLWSIWEDCVREGIHQGGCKCLGPLVPLEALFTAAGAWWVSVLWVSIWVCGLSNIPKNSSKNSFQ